MFGCKTKDYEPEIRNLLKGTQNLDLVTTQDLAYWNDLPKGVDIFLRGLKAGKSNDEIIGEMNSQIKGENPNKNLFAYKGGEDNKWDPSKPIPTASSLDDVLAGRVTIGPSKEYNPLAERAQKFLMKAGIKLGANNFKESDGYFGQKTTDAVKAFQKREKLPETGIIDSATMRKLEGYSEFA
jgi:murein L,D-transpeptidase YcbB/YkuD